MVPLFYIVLQRIIRNNFDEDLGFQRQWLEEKLRTTSPENFVSFNNNIIIRPGRFPQQERFYNEKLYIAYDNEMVPYRVLEFNNVTNGKPYAIRIQKSLMESEDVLRAIAAMQSGVLFILLSFLIFINARLRKTVWTPFYKTLNALNRYRIDRDEPLNLPDSNIQEIENLNRSRTNLPNTTARYLPNRKSLPKMHLTSCKRRWLSCRAILICFGKLPLMMRNKCTSCKISRKQLSE